EIYIQIQAKYGAKPPKPREIKKTLGKDDFLRIMITQMKNQDPTSPFKPEQMAAEMAQFTSVEQLQNLNQTMSKLTTQNQPLERMAMTNMIGKVVTIDRDRFPHTEGMQEALSFNLPADAAEVKVTVISELGEPMMTKDLGKTKAGEQSVNWDGMKNAAMPAKAGTYLMKVEAKDQQGKTIQTSTQSRAQVVGVSFEGNEPVFLVGDHKHQDRITMRNVVRIETGGPDSSGAGPSLGALGAEAKVPKVFSFEKGVGSTNLSPEQISPQLQELLAKSQTQLQGQVQAKAGAQAYGSPQPSVQNNIQESEKGFPNGLHDSDETPVKNSAPKIAGDNEQITNRKNNLNQSDRIIKGGDQR
ncbi:MAG: flagellar hook assembly protein FlgD, partial [Bdellovibrionota bacterium]